MPRYSFRFYENSVYIIEFDADNLDQAKQLIEDTIDVDDLPNSEKSWKKGDEDWDTDSLTETSTTDNDEETEDNE